MDQLPTRVKPRSSAYTHQQWMREMQKACPHMLNTVRMCVVIDIVGSFVKATISQTPEEMIKEAATNERKDAMIKP